MAAGPGLARPGCRYTDSSACMMRRGSPSESRSSRSIEPYDSIGDPRTPAIRSARRVSRRDGRS